MVTLCMSDGVAAGQAFILTLPYLVFCNVSDWLAGGQEFILPYLVFCNGCCFTTGYSLLKGLQCPLWHCMCEMKCCS